MPSNHPARARSLPPRHLLALAVLALSAAVVLWCARDAYAQSRTPGVGVPIPASIPAEWRSSWCPQLRVKPDNLTTWAKPEVFAAMQAAGWNWQTQCPSGWQGWWAEFFQRTEHALRGGWETNRWGTKNTHSGGYTLREIDYAQVYWPRCSDDYRVGWWERTEDGGSREKPYTFTPAATAQHADMVAEAKAAGVWPPFGETAAWPGGPAPCRGWTFWIRNEVGDAAVPTPTPPVATPTPTPRPAATPPPPVATPTPTCPTCPPAPVCAKCKPRCLAFEHGEGLTMRRIREGRTPSIDRLQALVRAIDARSGCWLR